MTDLLHKHYKKLILHKSNKVQKTYFYLVLIFSTMSLFSCDKPKEISPEKFQTLIQKSSDLHVVTYLGIEKEKAILKVSTRSSIDSEKWKDEYFYARETPDLYFWIDENIYGITVPNFNKLYSYLLSLENKEFQFGEWTILTRDQLRAKEKNKEIRITIKRYTYFTFSLDGSKIAYRSLSIKFNPARDVRYKELWRELMNHIR
ncbi:hypothetical protein [Leptospira santarosai]|uniref:hypothetical protein n=1 Tax=Leptospira santarosai TaxID=28183 RepID=UPI0024AFF122|nr:hypothetical protein [Leptospira santarosai]MDI7173505.1 hypothetical protein [Leptospira santarosai]MDI7193514.1 hypothetical protein [Leptospira santarosai]MDO6394202.1 hypothetical protein [Leptospira santarosai]MDO6397557.1 hypothetical protein [Leptospira santarosai]MDO6403353.1 hypothetical protein [Leptospira santarosai]